MIRVPEWRTRAACRGRVDLDFIDPRTPAEAAECRALCAGCPVREQCLVDALSTGEAWGIWGGLDADQREPLAEQQGHPPPAVKPAHGTNPRYAKHGCRCDACRQAHTAYERARRARRRAGDPCARPAVLGNSMQVGRTWTGANQYLLPLPGLASSDHREQPRSNVSRPLQLPRSRDPQMLWHGGPATTMSVISNPQGLPIRGFHR